MQFLESRVEAEVALPAQVRRAAEGRPGAGQLLAVRAPAVPPGLGRRVRRAALRGRQRERAAGVAAAAAGQAAALDARAAEPGEQPAQQKVCQQNPTLLFRRRT